MSWESTIVGFIHTIWLRRATWIVVVDCTLTLWIQFICWFIYSIKCGSTIKWEPFASIEKICTQWNCEMCSFGYQIEFDPDVIPSDPIQAAYAKFKKLYTKNVCVCAHRKRKMRKITFDPQILRKNTHFWRRNILYFFLYSFDLIHSRLCNIGFVSVAIRSAMR